MIGKAIVVLLVPAVAIAVEEVPPADPVDVAWGVVISVVVTRVLEWWLDWRRRRPGNDRRRRP